MSTLVLGPESMLEHDASFVGPPKPSALDVHANGTLQAEPVSKSGLAQVISLLGRFGSLSSFIRVLGVGAVVASMCLFLVDGVSAINDTQRFYTMLAFTGLLSAGGFALAFVLKEQRGARSFFGLALLSVPINFAVLGALYYSVFQFDRTSALYPSVAHWEILDVASLGMVTLVAVASLLLVTVLSVSIMAREARVWLSVALLGSCSFLLLPIRDTTWIAPLVAVLVVALIQVVRKNGETVISLKTLSGRFVQALLFLPPGIMLFRSFWLYSVSDLSVMVIALTLFAGVRYASQRIESPVVLANALHSVSAYLAIVAAYFGALWVHSFLPAVFLEITFIALFGGLMFELESRVQSKWFARFISVANYTVLAAAVLFGLIFLGSLLSFVVGSLTTIVLAVLSAIRKRRAELFISGMALAAMLLLYTDNIVWYINHAGWFGLATLGGLAILSASLIERFGPVLSLRITQKRS